MTSTMLLATGAFAGVRVALALFGGSFAPDHEGMPIVPEGRGPACGAPSPSSGRAARSRA